MDWGDTAEQAAFRAEVRAFVEARLPERYKHDPFDSGEHGAGATQMRGRTPRLARQCYCMSRRRGTKA